MDPTVDISTFSQLNVLLKGQCIKRLYCNRNIQSTFYGNSDDRIGIEKRKCWQMSPLCIALLSTNE